jgi:hypothetical protein
MLRAKSSLFSLSPLRYGDIWNISSHWIERIPYVVSQISNDDSSRPIEEILLNILVKTRHRASADPRDKVYVLLPLLSKVVRDSKLTPNYGLSPAVVFIDTAIYLMEHWGIGILCGVQWQSELVNMPSWIPD